MLTGPELEARIVVARKASNYRNTVFFIRHTRWILVQNGLVCPEDTPNELSPDYHYVFAALLPQVATSYVRVPYLTIDAVKTSDITQALACVGDSVLYDWQQEAQEHRAAMWGVKDWNPSQSVRTVIEDWRACYPQLPRDTLVAISELADLHAWCMDIEAKYQEAS